MTTRREIYDSVRELTYQDEDSLSNAQLQILDKRLAFDITKYKQPVRRTQEKVLGSALMGDQNSGDSRVTADGFWDFSSYQHFEAIYNQYGEPIRTRPSLGDSAFVNKRPQYYRFEKRLKASYLNPQVEYSVGFIKKYQPDFDLDVETDMVLQAHPSVILEGLIWQVKMWQKAEPAEIQSAQAAYLAAIESSTDEEGEDSVPLDELYGEYY